MEHNPGAFRTARRSNWIDAPIYFIVSILQWKAAAERESEMNAEIAASTAEVRKAETELE